MSRSIIVIKLDKKSEVEFLKILNKEKYKDYTEGLFQEKMDDFSNECIGYYDEDVKWRYYADMPEEALDDFKKIFDPIDIEFELEITNFIKNGKNKNLTRGWVSLTDNDEKFYYGDADMEMVNSLYY